MTDFLTYATSDAKSSGADDNTEWAITFIDGTKVYGRLIALGNSIYRLTDSSESVSYINATHVQQAAIHDSRGMFDVI